MGANLKKKILLIGGGGHCHSVLDSVFATGIYDDIGIIDSVDCSSFGISVVGTDEDIPKLYEAGWKYAFITIGSIGNTVLRRELYNKVKCLGINIPSIIDPSAVVARGTDISEGVYVGKKAIINTGSKIGPCAIINSGAIVEHDCVIGQFSHISPGTTICGQVSVGDDSHVGAGTVVRQLIRIGENAIIGAGSVVVKNIPKNVTAYGNPCKVVAL